MSSGSRGRREKRNYLVPQPGDVIAPNNVRAAVLERLNVIDDPARTPAVYFPVAGQGWLRRNASLA